MAFTPNHRMLAMQASVIAIWIVLVAVAAVGVMFAVLFIAGEVRFAVAECGLRYEWSENTYSFCSDIDESNTFFFGFALLGLAPICIGRLMVWLRTLTRKTAHNQASAPPGLFAEGLDRIIGRITLLVAGIACVVFAIVVAQDIALARAICPSTDIPDPCPNRWSGVAVVAVLEAVYMLPIAIGLICVLSRRAALRRTA